MPAINSVVRKPPVTVNKKPSEQDSKNILLKAGVAVVALSVIAAIAYVTRPKCNTLPIDAFDKLSFGEDLEGNSLVSGSYLIDFYNGNFDGQCPWYTSTSKISAFIEKILKEEFSCVPPLRRDIQCGGHEYRSMFLSRLVEKAKEFGIM